MRNALLAALFLSLPVATLAAPLPGNQPGAVISAPTSGQFTVTTNVQVPGKTLKPGVYTIAVLDKLSDRLILRITNHDGKTEATFLGLYMDAPANPGPGQAIAWSNTQGKHALRGYAFPSSQRVEFVYPKSEAVEIAKHNTEKVLAIDPSSDNLSQQSDQLSPSDMQVLTLWALSSTRVGPDNKSAIEATRYEPPVKPEHATSATSTLAPGPPPANHHVAPVQMASNTRKPLLSALPHTANNIVAPFSLSLLAFTAAGLLWFRRVYVFRARSHNESRS